MTRFTPSEHLPRLTLVLVAFAIGSACTCGTKPATPTLKKETEACARDEECETGLCEAAAGFQTICVRKCTDGCLASEVCTQLTPGRFSCKVDKGGLCQTCQVDSDCPYPADKCLVVDGKPVCGRDCAYDQKCPTSYQCVNGLGTDGQAKSQQCTPTSGSCNCTASTAGQKVSCDLTNGFGTCHGFRTCDGVAGYGACDAKTPAIEVCNGKDDNCDGRTDEGQPTVTCGVGVCQRTVASCGDGGLAACVPGDAGVELCNGLDDDCDGTPDNGFNLASDINNCGTCNHVCTLANATPRCGAGQCEVQSCNSGFGNCDLVATNGCEKNLNTDVDNCNACGNRCTAAGANSTCVGGACRFTCLAGYYDLDGNPANGCEYQCTYTSATDLPDLSFVDANCDGIDGEVTNGIFVSPLGDDANPGTMALPKRTIGAGALAATTGMKRDVYVSAGTYLGPLDLNTVTSKNIAGGYAPAGARWTRSAVNSTIVSGGSPALTMTSDDNVLVQFITFNGASVTGTDASGNGKTAYGAMLKTTNARFEQVTVVAGDGSDGAPGTPGTSGTPGGNGAVGIGGCTNGDPSIPYLCNTCARPTSGTGGFSACGAGRNGGGGGLPGLDTNASGSSGAVGQLATPAGLGGPAYNNYGVGYSQPLAIQQGTWGVAGTAGSNGAASSALGTLTALGYLPPIGGSATGGLPGEGGGGGGGGGGGCIDLVIFGIFQTCWCPTYGSSGGGGGAGGCGGLAGTVGHSGGASIALSMWDSNLTVTNLSVSAGRGGNGGNGGAGGTGGTGGTGASSVHDPGNQGYSGIGGRGGNGGSGGNGGNGAGGSGGPVFGIAHNGNSHMNSASGFVTTQVSFTLGVGGVGGTSPGNAGPAGAVQQAQAF